MKWKWNYSLCQQAMGWHGMVPHYNWVYLHLTTSIYINIIFVYRFYRKLNDFNRFYCSFQWCLSILKEMTVHTVFSSIFPLRAFDFIALTYIFLHWSHTSGRPCHKSSLSLDDLNIILNLIKIIVFDCMHFWLLESEHNFAYLL